MRARRWRPGRATPRVKGGTVQRKNSWDHYYKAYDLEPEAGVIPIVQEVPIRRFRHPVTESDLRQFLPLIRDWDRYSEGLRCLVLEDGDYDALGWHADGVIALCAWDGFEQEWSEEFCAEHAQVLEHLAVPMEDNGDGYVWCKFTRETARGFQLMHVFLHEIGHHYDRMLTKQQESCPRGEEFADGFADRLATEMWPAFYRSFGM